MAPRQGAYTSTSSRDIKEGKQMITFLKTLRPAKAQSADDAPAADGVLSASAVRARLARELPAASSDAIDLLEKVSRRRSWFSCFVYTVLIVDALCVIVLVCLHLIQQHALRCFVLVLVVVVGLFDADA